MAKMEKFYYLKEMGASAIKEREQPISLEKYYIRLQEALSARPDLKILVTRAPTRADKTQIIPKQGMLYLPPQNDPTYGSGELKVRIGKNILVIPQTEASQWLLAPADIIEAEHVYKTLQEKRVHDSFTPPLQNKNRLHAEQAETKLCVLAENLIKNPYSLEFDPSDPTILVISSPADKQQLNNLANLALTSKKGRVDSAARRIILSGAFAHKLLRDAMQTPNYIGWYNDFISRNPSTKDENFRLTFEPQNPTTILICAYYE